MTTPEVYPGFRFAASGLRYLEKLDNDEEVKREGRSAVIRRAVADYLHKKRWATIAAAYRRAYGKQPAELDLRGWTDEGI